MRKTIKTILNEFFNFERALIKKKLLYSTPNPFDTTKTYTFVKVQIVKLPFLNQFISLIKLFFTKHDAKRNFPIRIYITQSRQLTRKAGIVATINNPSGSSAHDVLIPFLQITAPRPGEVIIPPPALNITEL